MIFINKTRKPFRFYTKRLQLIQPDKIYKAYHHKTLFN